MLQPALHTDCSNEIRRVVTGTQAEKLFYCKGSQNASIRNWNVKLFNFIIVLAAHTISGPHKSVPVYITKAYGGVEVQLYTILTTCINRQLNAQFLYSLIKVNQVYQYKNANIKLYKNSAAVWYNKTCRRPIIVTIPETVYIQFSS